MPYTTYTLTDLRTQLAARWDRAAFWTDEEARLAINESFRTWNLLVGAWRQRFVTATVANSPYYVTPAGAFVPIHITWREQPLDDGSLADLDRGRPSWRSETVASGGEVPAVPTLWAPLGVTRFVIWPADTVATHQLAIDAVIPAPALVTPSDTADVNEADLGLLLGFALRLAAFKKPGQRFLELKSHEDAFYKAAAVQSAAFRASAVYRAYLGQDRSRWQRPERVPLSPEPARPAGGDT